MASVIGALDRLVHYYEKNYELLSLDGIFGAKAIEGQLNLVVAKHNKGLLSDAVDRLMKDDLSSMATRAGRVVRLALPHLHKTQPVAMTRLRRIFQLSWDIGHPRRLLDTLLLWDDKTRKRAALQRLTDSEMDRCLSELLEPMDGVMCGMKQDCQEAMTQPGMTHYTLTRQIKYSIVAEMSGCGSRLEQWLVRNKRTGSLEQLQAEMCANLYMEARTLPSFACIDPNPALVWDLFLEMEFVCGMLGYTQFLQEPWLRSVLAWQQTSGCYATKPPSWTAGANLAAFPGGGGSGLPGLELLGGESPLSDGCLAHLTGVAASSLAVHLHSLLSTSQSGISVAIAHPAPNAPLSVPSAKILPPPLPNDSAALLDRGGYAVNTMLFRGDIHSGLNRIAEQEKSLEDKADLLLQRLEDENRADKERRKKEKKLKKKTKKNGNIRLEETAYQNMPQAAGGHSRHLVLPEMAVPLTLPAAGGSGGGVVVWGSVPGSAAALSTTTTPSPAPVCFLALSVVLVAVALARYIHSRRRRCNLAALKGKFRL